MILVSMAPHKLYIDSRAHMNAADTSHADFNVQLPRLIEVPERRAFIDSVHLPNTFTAIHSQNKYIYVVERVGQLSTVYMRKLVLMEGSYNGTQLATHLENVLNTQIISTQSATGTKLGVNSYVVAFSSAVGNLTISKQNRQRLFRILAPRLPPSQLSSLDDGRPVQLYCQ